MLTYAKAGGPPDNWMGLRIIDLATGEEVREVIEVNTVEGWLLRHARDATGEPFLIAGRDGSPELAIERVSGAFRIEQIN